MKKQQISGMKYIDVSIKTTGCGNASNECWLGVLPCLLRFSELYSWDI